MMADADWSRAERGREEREGGKWHREERGCAESDRAKWDREERGRAARDRTDCDQAGRGCAGPGGQLSSPELWQGVPSLNATQGGPMTA